MRVEHVLVLVRVRSNEAERLAECSFKPNRYLLPNILLRASNLQVHACNADGYGFIDFEDSNSTIASVFRHPPRTVVQVEALSFASPLETCRKQGGLSAYGGPGGLPMPSGFDGGDSWIRGVEFLGPQGGSQTFPLSDA